MKKSLVIALTVLIAIVVLLVVLILALPALADTQAFRNQLSQQVQKHTGQTLTIEGDFSLSVFPWLGIRTDKVSLSQPPALGDGNFITMGSADIRLKLLPLLFDKQLVMKQVHLQQPTIHYRVDSQGNSSLDGLLAPSTDSETAADQSSTGNTSSPLAGLFFPGITLTEGKIVVDDQQQNQHIELKEVNLTTGNLLDTKPAPMELSGVFATAEAGFEPVTLSLRSEASLYPTTLTAIINNIRLSIAQGQDVVEGTIATLAFNGQQQQLAGEQLQLSGQSEKFTATPINPQLTLPKFAVDLAKETTAKMAFTLSENRSGAVINGSLEAADWGQQLTYKGAIDNTTVNPKALLSLLAVDYQPSDSQALSRVGFSTEFSGSDNGLALKNMAAMVDDSKFTGDLALIDFSQPEYRFDISLDKLNVDRYLPATTATTPAKSDTAATGTALAVPMEIFKTLTANGVFRAGQLQANGAKLTDLILKVTSSQGRVVIEPKASAYQGTIDSKLTFTETGNQSTLAVTSAISSVLLEPLLKDTDITDQLSGLANINTDIVVTEVNGQQTNNGTIAINIKDGALKNIDIKSVLDDTQRRLDEVRGKTTTGTTTPKEQTRFTEMLAKLTLVNNVLSNDDLNIKAPGFRITGKGGIDITQQTLNYLTNITVVNTNEGQGGKDRADLKGLVIPVAFKGPITQPKYDIDIKAIAKANTEQAVDRKKDELKDELKDKATEKLGLPAAEDGGATTKETLKEEAKKKLLDKLLK